MPNNCDTMACGLVFVNFFYYFKLLLKFFLTGTGCEVLVKKISH